MLVHSHQFTSTLTSFVFKPSNFVGGFLFPKEKVMYLNLRFNNEHISGDWMDAFIKIIVGAILILVGLGLFLDSAGMPQLVPDIMVGKYNLGNIDWLGNFFDLVTGFIPPFLILIGLFVVWLELDEMKLQKELKTEEKSERKKEKKEEIKEQAKK